MIAKSWLTLALVLMLVACGEKAQETGVEVTPQMTQTASQIEPQDPVIAEIYNRSCRSCHAVGASLAPLTGNREQWAPRLGQGMDTLLNHTIDGYGGMPPLGMCFECDAQQFEALITFMATGEE